MRYTGSKNKVARRENFDLGLKTPGSKAHASLLRKINITPGQHGAKRKRKVSERARQLRQKQKLRFLFGISETKLKKYFQKAVGMPGNTGSNLAQLLERRLDNVVYRAGFAPTRASARQLVSHGHVQVNGRKLNVASHEVRAGDSVTFKHEKTAKIPYIEVQLSDKTTIIPPWIARREVEAKVVTLPSSEDIEKQLNLRPVIEYYSR